MERPEKRDRAHEPETGGTGNKDDPARDHRRDTGGRKTHRSRTARTRDDRHRALRKRRGCTPCHPGCFRTGRPCFGRSAGKRRGDYRAGVQSPWRQRRRKTPDGTGGRAGRGQARPCPERGARAYYCGAEEEFAMTGTVVVLEPGDERAQKIAKAMASQTANDILTLLATGTKSLTDITEQLSIPLTTTKYHTGNLLDAGLITVSDTRYSIKGREVKMYSLTDQLLIVAPKQTNVRALLLKYSFSLGSSLPVRLQSSHLHPCSPCRQRPGRRPSWRPGWGRKPGCTRQMPWPVMAWCRNSPPVLHLPSSSAGFLSSLSCSATRLGSGGRGVPFKSLPPCPA